MRYISLHSDKSAEHARIKDIKNWPHEAAGMPPHGLRQRACEAGQGPRSRGGERKSEMSNVM